MTTNITKKKKKNIVIWIEISNTWENQLFYPLIVANCWLGLPVKMHSFVFFLSPSSFSLSIPSPSLIFYPSLLFFLSLFLCLLLPSGRFLESQNLMDYSFLLGIRDPQQSDIGSLIPPKKEKGEKGERKKKGKEKGGKGEKGEGGKEEGKKGGKGKGKEKGKGEGKEKEKDEKDKEKEKENKGKKRKKGKKEKEKKGKGKEKAEKPSTAVGFIQTQMGFWTAIGHDYTTNNNDKDNNNDSNDNKDEKEVIEMSSIPSHTEEVTEALAEEMRGCSCVFVFGIIDVLENYGTTKKIPHAVKVFSSLFCPLFCSSFLFFLFFFFTSNQYSQSPPTTTITTTTRG